MTKELPKVIANLLGERLSGKCSITGHSMGGHGALICGLKNPGQGLTIVYVRLYSNLQQKLNVKINLDKIYFREDLELARLIDASFKIKCKKMLQ